MRLLTFVTTRAAWSDDVASSTYIRKSTCVVASTCTLLHRCAAACDGPAASLARTEYKKPSVVDSSSTCAAAGVGVCARTHHTADMQRQKAQADTLTGRQAGGRKRTNVCTRTNTRCARLPCVEGAALVEAEDKIDVDPELATAPQHAAPQPHAPD
jgi:hypothetical protein